MKFLESVMYFWEFDRLISKWTPLKHVQLSLLDGRQLKRGSQCFAYDSGQNSLLMFGGVHASTGYRAMLNDLWVYSFTSGNWTQETYASVLRPAAGQDYTCTVNSANRTFYASSPAFVSGTADIKAAWQYDMDEKIWTLTNPDLPPIPIVRHRIVYVAALNSLLGMFGRDAVRFQASSNVYMYSFENPSANWTLVRTGPLKPSFSGSAPDVVHFKNTTSEAYIFGPGRIHVYH
jgi:hypothetical protein